MASKPCATGVQNQVSNGAIDIEFATVTLVQGNNANGVDRDIHVLFKKPHTFFMLAAITSVFASCSVYVHFRPLQLPTANTGTSITPSGGENWIPLANLTLAAGDKAEGRWLKFNRPVIEFWIDADHSGHTGAETFLMTFLGSNDIDFAVAEQS